MASFAFPRGRPGSLQGGLGRLAAGNPFRGWAWTSTWWRHYGDRPSGSSPAGLPTSDDGRVHRLFISQWRPRAQASCPWYPASHLGRFPRGLYVLAVFDDAGRLAGLAPWHVDCSHFGAACSASGSGEVCSEYLGILMARTRKRRSRGPWRSGLSTHPAQRTAGTDGAHGRRSEIGAPARSSAR